jgi:SAM-dependent methyltransferase
VLELGCASGGSLIPLAYRHPESECVGVELSRVQAEAGARFISHMGLANVRILHGDLAALPNDIGQFDYIIAHGVFSWVPPSVQDALLELCRQHLTASGVAFISFNVAAGWEKFMPLREALMRRTASGLPANRRYQQARAVLDELEMTETDPALQKEIAYLKTAAPSYLFHEYLAEFNAPMTFTDFAVRLDAHELRYVGEAGPRRAVVELEDAWGLIPESMAGRWLDAEAALDDVLTTRFRRALVCRDDAPFAQPPRAEALTGLAFYADITSEEEIDLDTDTEQAFVNPAGNTFPVAAPLAKAAMMALSLAYPNALSYESLRAAAQSVMAELGAQKEQDEAQFLDALFQLVMLHGVMPTVSDRHLPAEPGERPCAHALARLQAATPGWVVSGARHVAMDMDAPGRELLTLLDGSHTLDELATLMHARLLDSGLSLTREQVDALTHQQLWQFARQGLIAA